VVAQEQDDDDRRRDPEPRPDDLPRGERLRERAPLFGSTGEPLR
jgi:hypothetical protein